MSGVDNTRNTTKLQPEEPAHVRRAAEDLAKSGITLEEAKRNGAIPLSPLDTRRHSQDGLNFNSLLFFYRGFDGKPLHYTNSAGEQQEFLRLRMYPDDPEVFTQRYWQPGKSGCALFLPQSVDWEKVLKDQSYPIYITEGEKKAIKMTIESLTAVALGGVDNFVSLQGLLPELSALAKGGRPMYIVFDGGDDQWNEGVRRALSRLASMLTEAGANVGTISLPPGYKIDDYLLENNAETFADLPIRAWDVRKSLKAVREGKQSAYKKKQQVSSMIRGHMLENGKFFRSELNETYYFSDVEKVLVSMDDMKATKLRAFLYGHYGTNASEVEYRYVMEDLQTYCVRHGISTVVNVFSYWNAEAGLLYIAAGDHKMWKISEEGYEVVSNGSDNVLMKSCEGPGIELAEELEEGVDYFGKPFHIPNYADPDAEPLAILALKIFTLSILFPQANPTKIIPLFHGPKGSHKTSASRALVQLIIGPNADVLGVDGNVENDLWTHVDKHPIAAVDNVDGNIKGLANTLATISTGGVKTKRKLYSNTEEVMIPIRAAVMASSRNPRSFGRGDIVDRLLVFSCTRRGTNYKPESVMTAETRSLRPYWWAYLLKLLPKVIKALREAPVGRTYEWRMADYARMLYTASSVLGYTEEEADELVAWQTKERNSFAAEHGTLVGLLRACFERYADSSAVGIESRPEGWLKARALYAMLREVYTGRSFPFENEVSLGRSMSEDWETVEAQCGSFFERAEDKRNGGWKYRWLWRT